MNHNHKILNSNPGQGLTRAIIPPTVDKIRTLYTVNTSNAMVTYGNVAFPLLAKCHQYN